MATGNGAERTALSVIRSRREETTDEVASTVHADGAARLRA